MPLPEEPVESDDIDPGGFFTGPFDIQESLEFTLGIGVTEKTDEPLKDQVLFEDGAEDFIDCGPDESMSFTVFVEELIEMVLDKSVGVLMASSETEDIFDASDSKSGMLGGDFADDQLDLGLTSGVVRSASGFFCFPLGPGTGLCQLG